MNNIFRNITPAVAVMVAGLAGAYMVYDNFFSTKAGESVAMISPAAGEMTEDSIIIAESAVAEGAAAVATEAAPVVDEAVAATEAAVTTEVTPAPDCSVLDAAATAAMGGVDAEKAAKEAADCHAAAAAAAAPVEAAPEAAPAASEGAVEEAAPAVDGHDAH
ncbi:MAG: colicin transporter [Alphaproteobacteria bacterium]|nr:colicin transporter [Alphaproteobacteria bacterium]